MEMFSPILNDIELFFALGTFPEMVGSMRAKLVQLPYFAGRESRKLLFTSGKCTNIWLEICKDVPSVDISSGFSSFSGQTYFQSTRFLILFSLCPHISQSNGTPCDTSLGVFGTRRSPFSASARLETKEECDAIVAA